MRRLAWVLTFVVLTTLPGRALADEHRPVSPTAYSSSCGVRLNDDDTGSLRGIRCTTGQAVKISGSWMKVRPFHGSSLQVRFTDSTEFATDSGEGVLDGLAVPDYVCVAYLTRQRTATALLVLFDPKFVPCHVHS